MKRIAIPIESNELCHYGCLQKAKYKNGSGNLMCCACSNSCPALKKKNSEACKQAHSNGSRKPMKELYKSLPQETKEKMAWSKGLNKDNDERVRKHHTNRHNNFIQGKWKPHISGVASNPQLRWKRNYIPYFDSDGTYFKLESMHEWEVANILDKAGVHWVRPKPIVLFDGRKYEPDFYLKDYDIFLDPKSLWDENSKNKRSQKIVNVQKEQLKKIELCRNETKHRILILYNKDKRSHSWEGILAQILEYTASGEIGETHMT